MPVLAMRAYQLEVADADGARARTLYSSSEPILSASWSPDGKRVAYVSFETGRPSIILQDIDGPYRERLTNLGSSIARQCFHLTVKVWLWCSLVAAIQKYL